LDKALGKITANAGVPVRFTTNELVPTRILICHSYMVQALPGNTGKVYILDDPGGAGATMSHVIAWLPAPTVNSAPSFTATIDTAPNDLNVSTRWLDVEIDGEGAIISVAITP